MRENNNSDGPIQFPCQFDIKVMGKTNSNIEASATEIIKKFCFNVDVRQKNRRASRDGNFVALTFTIEAESKAQLNEIYLALNECSDVIMVL